MAALAAAAAAARQALGRGAVDRAGQGRLRRHQHGHRSTVAGLRRDGRLSEFTEIPQLRFQIGRWDYRDWIRERIDPWMRERTVEEIVELGQLFRLPLAPLGNGSTIPDMDHLRLAASTSAIRLDSISPAHHG